MLVGQFNYPSSLHAEIKKAKVLGSYADLSFPKWHQLASLMLLHVLGLCPDREAAERFGADVAVVAVFSRLIDGRGIPGVPGTGTEA